LEHPLADEAAGQARGHRRSGGRVDRQRLRYRGNRHRRRWAEPHMSDNQLHDAGLPWRGAPDDIACNFAVGDLILNLPRLLTVDGKIHAPTLLAASGAIAGYAAQQALLSELSTDPAALQRNGLQLVETATGNQYYFGDLLNARLLRQGTESGAERLWSM